MTLRMIALTALLLSACTPTTGMATYGSALSGVYADRSYPVYGESAPGVWHSQYMVPQVRCVSQGNTMTCRPI